jgi:hypothetical protein
MNLSESYKNRITELAGIKSDWHYDIDDKLKLLKSYINILNNASTPKKHGYIPEDYSIQKKYFLLIYNWLIIERMFYPDVVLVGKELNKNLHLEKLNSLEEVLKKFSELYDTYSKVRFAIETFDSIDSIRQYLKSHPEVYNKFLKK